MDKMDYTREEMSFMCYIIKQYSNLTTKLNKEDKKEIELILKKNAYNHKLKELELLKDDIDKLNSRPRPEDINDI